MTEDYSDLPKSASLAPPPPNPSEVQRMTMEQMQATMRARFGDDPGRWSFVCPSCATVQCAADLEPLGPVAKGHVGRICVNVWRAQDDPRKCWFTATGPAGGPLSITQETIAGPTMRPGMQIAPAPGGDGG